MVENVTCRVYQEEEETPFLFLCCCNGLVRGNLASSGLNSYIKKASRQRRGTKDFTFAWTTCIYLNYYIFLIMFYILLDIDIWIEKHNFILYIFQHSEHIMLENLSNYLLTYIDFQFD